MTPERTSKSPSALNRTFDWPLSKAERKDVLISFNQRQLDALEDPQDLQESQDEADGASDGLRVLGQSSSTGKLETCPKECLTASPRKDGTWPPKRFSIESGVSTISASVISNKSWSDDDVKETLNAFQLEMARQQQKQFEQFQRQQQEQMDTVLARIAEEKLSKSQGYQADDNSSCSSNRRSDCRKGRIFSHSCPERTAQSPQRPTSALKGRRRSRGSSLPRVRFVEVDEGTSSEEDVLKQSTASASMRGRAGRRVSRGPDGRTYSVDSTDSKAEEASSQSAAAGGGHAKAAAFGVAGGVAGLSAGVIGGAMAGLPAALFTFGLSIPIGAAFGGGIGVSAGAGAGAAVGYSLSSASTAAQTPRPEPEASEDAED